MQHDAQSCTLFWAFLFAFYLMACLANIVPSSFKSFDPRHHLIRCDVASNELGLIVTFHCTKTIQFGERKLHIPLLRIPDSPLCPVSAYHRMVRLVPASPRSALFLLPSLRGSTPLTKHWLVTEFHSSLATAGVPDGASFWGHSFRRGAASWAFNHGVPGELIQLYGGWTSDAYKVYLEFSVQSKITFAHQPHSAVQSIST